MATKPEQPWTLTLRQYERAIMESCLAGMPDNDKISKAEYLRLYPNDCRLQEWVREIEQAIDHHESISAKVLDDVFRRCPERVGWAFLKRNKDYLACCQAGGKGSLSKLYADFGDVRGDSFKEWWTSDGTKSPRRSVRRGHGRTFGTGTE